MSDPITYTVPERRVVEAEAPQSLASSAWADLGKSGGGKVFALCPICHELISEDVALAINPTVGADGFHKAHRSIEIGEPGLGNESWFLRVLESGLNDDETSIVDSSSSSPDDEVTAYIEAVSSMPAPAMDPVRKPARISWSPTFLGFAMVSLTVGLLIYSATLLYATLVGVSP